MSLRKRKTEKRKKTKEKEKVLVVQSEPVNPGGQTQSLPGKSSKHVPLFPHGWVGHTFTSFKKKKKERREEAKEKETRNRLLFLFVCLFVFGI